MGFGTAGQATTLQSGSGFGRLTVSPEIFSPPGVHHIDDHCHPPLLDLSFNFYVFFFVVLTFIDVSHENNNDDDGEITKEQR